MILLYGQNHKFCMIHPSSSFILLPFPYPPTPSVFPSVIHDIFTWGSIWLVLPEEKMDPR